MRDEQGSRKFRGFFCLDFYPKTKNAVEHDSTLAKIDVQTNPTVNDSRE
jgi:hypothetical protein